MAYTDTTDQKPQTFTYMGRSYEVPWRTIAIWDDAEHADWLASELGTYAKHAKSKWTNPWWATISVVGLP